MNSDFTEHHSSRPRRNRAEMLLQLLFEERITEDEAAELLDLWERFPEIAEDACNRYETENLVSFIAKLEKWSLTLRLPNRMEYRLPTPRNIFSETTDDQFDEVFLANLVHLATLSPSIPVAPSNTISNASNTEHTRKSGIKPFEWKYRFRAFFPVLVIGLAALFVFAIYREFWSGSHARKTTGKQYLATVTAALDVRMPSGTDQVTDQIKEGRTFDTERIRFESGTLEIEMRNGTRIALDGPVDFQLHSMMKTACNVGNLSVTVPPEGKGFEVATPHLTLRDLGTKFAIDVSEKETDLHVIQGKVAANWFNGDWPTFETGEAIRLEKMSTKPTRMIAEPKRFVSDEQIREKMRIRDAKQFETSRQQAKRLQVDPSLLLFLDFDNISNSIVNQATGVNGKTLGGRKTRGRWEGKGAFEFSASRDGIEFAISERFHSMTLSASIRIESLPRLNHVLLASRDVGQGHLFWQIRNDGTVHLGIQPKRDQSMINYTSSQVFTNKTWGTWYRITTVYDNEAETVSFYLDKALISTQPITSNLAIQPGTVTVGNGFWGSKSVTQRSFHGQMDEFLLFNRALSAEEVALLSP